MFQLMRNLYHAQPLQHLMGSFSSELVPFGLYGTLAAFQRMMDSIFQEFPVFVAAYLDDVGKHSNSWEDHLMHIQAVLLKIHETELTIKT